MRNAQPADRQCLEQRSSAIRDGIRRAFLLVGVNATSGVLGCGADDDGNALRTTDSPVGIVAREPGFVPLACATDESQLPLYIEHLRPSVPLDYLDFRFGTHVVQSIGTACGTATVPSVCRAALDALPAEPRIALGQNDYYHLAGTRGDEVLRVGTLVEQLELFGDIDSVGEAQLVVTNHGYDLWCGESGTVPMGDGFNVLGFTTQGCSGRTRHLVHVDPNGQTSLSDSFVERVDTSICFPGRRPEARPPLRVLRSSLGRFFADCAALEAASVPAFSRLARELEAHRAPRALVRRALRSARDEVRHARHVGALARRFGGAPRFPRLPLGRVRGLEHIALENTVEGCVHETYAALLAHHQAACAPDRAIAVTYRTIAGDETRHAELAWDVARWLEQRLPASARRRVTEARQHAARVLMCSLARSRPSGIDTAAGLPSPSVALALAEQLDASLWRDGLG